ncbi:hypothetical protein Tco_0803653 [Tanacetum coccineum]|uniref:Uncharacterized protein n=1 Tax=Tanacetum coccineum TaxID=301880 RepID=A0ABQ5A6G3_9ASTR
MFLNMDQLEKQLDKEEFQDIGSMAFFKVLEIQFQMFIKSRIYLDDEYVKSIDERAQYKREYDSWVNKRQMQKTEEKVDSSKALDASLADTESSGTALKEQDTSSKSGNDCTCCDADIRPIYDEDPMLRIEHTLFDCKNVDFKAQLQEKGFAIAALKNELRKLTGNSMNTKFEKSSILGKPVLQSLRNQSVVRQPNAFKERESAFAKPHHVIAPRSSRYSSNNMVHNHYLEEAKKKTQESGRNSEPSVMPSARSESTTNGSKPKPRINNQKSRN